ncbi:MAG: UbiH/UbiF/VisC/COQ6 family ubiquinone biosynthesis hydroxylase [Rhodobacterales bacterium]|nr:UbiH/UbiF/VisC/COQ6 family ubiquinone biosynthesis hydroxylase [Rhodobacterales bacterium]
MSDATDILIVGGGLNGPALGLALAQAGLRATVIDNRPDLARAEAGFDGRAYALAQASRRLLTAIGVWPAVGHLAQPIRRIVASDGRPAEGAAPFFLDFSSDEIEEGPMGWILEDRHLFAAFRDRMAAVPGLTHLPGETVVAQQTGPAGASVTLASGRVLTGRVIVGADGRGSGTATRAGIRRQGWTYGQTALVAAIAHDRPHDGVAHQLFLPSGPLAILPLPGNVSSIVWSERDDTARAIAALDDDDFLTALRPRFGDFLGAIRLAGDRFSYPLSLSLAERYVAPRLALVGDAAHGVHPLAGQGLNLGLRDVAALAQVLVAARRRGEDPGAPDVLDRYRTWRRGDATLLALGMDAMNRLFSNDNPILRLGRDLGLAAVAAAPALRRGFIRQAAGLSGDLPVLLTGRAL